MKKIVLAIAAIILILGFVFCYVVAKYSEKDTGPVRPHNVPSSAKWYGGQKGGVWIEYIAKRSDKMTFYLKIYADVTGSLCYEGKYYYKGKSNMSTNEILSSFSGWTGSNVFLKNGEYLETEGYDDKEETNNFATEN